MMKFDQWRLILAGAAFVLAALITAVKAFGAAETFYMPAQWGYLADSVWFVPYVDGVAADSAAHDNLAGLDTTVTVADNTHYLAAWKIFSGGDTLPQVWAWVYDNRTISASATVDSASISRYVWNAPTANHVTAGTFGYNLDGTISGISSPGSNGPYSYTFVIYDTTNDAPIEGAKMTTRTTDQSSIKVYGYSDINGEVTGTLGEAGSTIDYLLLWSAPGYQITAETVSVGPSGLTDTAWATYIQPTAPTGDSVCAIYGYLELPTGDGISDVEIFFTLPEGTWDECGDAALPILQTKCETNTAGYFTTNLLYSGCLWAPNADDSVKYTMTVTGIPNRKWYIYVPSSSAYQITWEE